MDESTYQILGVAAELVDGLRDVAVRAADEHVVLFGGGGGEEGQEGGEEGEAHVGGSGGVGGVVLVLVKLLFCGCGAV